MADEEPTYLTVEEAAARLRVTPQTVYRWCRSGRLQATKIGKGWRIPARQLPGDPQQVGLLPLETLLVSLIEQPQHLLGLASDQRALERMETTFFELAAGSKGRLVHTRWEDTEATVRRRLRHALRRAPDGDDALHILDFKAAYEKGDVNGPIGLLLTEVGPASADGMICRAYGSPYPYFSYNLGQLVEYERAVAEHMRGQAALMLCGHALNDMLSLYGSRAFTLLMDLAECHDGIVCYDGQRALLERPA